MAPVVFVAHMGVHTSRSEKKVKKHLFKIQGVVDVCVSKVTGHVAIVGMADAATFGEVLAVNLGRPVFLLADFGAAPAPPTGGGSGVMPAPSHAFPVGDGDDVMPPPSPASSVAGGDDVMPPPSPASFLVDGGFHPCGAPRSRRLRAPPVGAGSFPAPIVGAGYYNPYAHQLRYAAPPPVGYYATPLGCRPRGPHYVGNDAPAEPFEDEYRHGRCCSIQ